MNEATIVGNLTSDPTYRLAERTGRGVVHFGVAVNRRRFDRESVEYTDLPPVFHRVVAFGPWLTMLRTPCGGVTRSWWLGRLLMTATRRGVGRSGSSS